ncbi:neurensin-1-like [Palaemon carinicauda]|uniref:neurensin-1-like n=1 Tax=Palaemon carinicauda TaxID=392227 RepID=UPI0035B5719D
MDDTDTESAETEPLVRHGRTTTGVGGGTTAPGGATKRAPPPANAPPRTPSRHQLEVKPRLSLVPETNEKSPDEDHPEGVPVEDQAEEARKKKKDFESPTPLCPFFGVRNYLHQFYEKPDVHDPTLYEDIQPDEQIYLVKQTDGGCSSSVFRLSLILGGLLLLLGVVAFIVAACAARRTTLISQTGGVSVIDRVASAHNAQVDALLLVGLVAVTLGSTVVAAALISRTFCSRPEEYAYPFRVGQYVLEPPLSPIERKVPATEKLTQVQPNWGSKGFLPFP